MSHVLIVDDHADIRRLLCVTLSAEYSILEASDGVTALDMVRRFHPRVVLLDVLIHGGMDGFQVLQAIKSNALTQNIRVAMVSERGLAVDQQMAEKLGADAYFVKPFSPVQLKAWIRNQISHNS